MKKLLLILALLLPSVTTAQLTVPQGGTGWGNIKAGAVIYGNTKGKLSTTTTDVADTGKYLKFNGTIPVWDTVAATGGDGTFSTTSADYWKTLRDFNSTTSLDYWAQQGNVLLNYIGNPSASKTFNMDGKNLVFSFINPTGADGAFEIEATGAYTGDLLHVHQHIGNPGQSDLVHFESTDSDVITLRLTGAGTSTLDVIGTSTLPKISGVQTLQVGTDYIRDLTGTGLVNTGNALTVDFTGYTPTSRNINTNAPLFGGGALSADLTLGTSFSTSSLNIFSQSQTWNASSTFNSTMNFLRGTTSGLAISGVTGTVLKTNATGGIIPAVAGTDYQVAGTYENALTFNWPLTRLVNAIGYAFSYPTTTANNWLSGQMFYGSSTASTFSFFTASGTRATTTGFAITGLSNCDTIDTDTSGNLKCGTDNAGTGGGGTYDWFQNLNYNTLTLTPSTSIPVWIKSAFYASSTAVFQNATATGFAIKGLVSCDTIDTDTDGNLKCGTDNSTAGSGGSNWVYGTNYNANALTPSTTIPVWFKDQIFASSTATFGSTVNFNSSTFMLQGKTFSIGTTTAIHPLTVLGRINASIAFSCSLPYLSNTSASAVDQLGAATLQATPCGGNLLYDINTDGTILLQTALEGFMASGSPLMQSMVASNASAGAANHLVVLKSVLLGSATSTGGLAFESWLQLPNVGITITTSTTSNSYGFGFSNVSAGSVTTHDAYFKPTDGIFLVASSTANWQLISFRNNVPYISNTTFATSTTPFKALLVVDGVNGASVYINDSSVAAGTVPYVNLPTTNLRAFIGVARRVAGTQAVANLRVARLKVWGGY